MPKKPKKSFSKRTSKKTSKKVKVIGTKEFIDPTTNELHNFQVVDVEERDCNFHKMFLKQFLTTVDLIGNQKMKLAFWIVDNLNHENQLVYNYRQIAEATGISLKTVQLTMQSLMECDFLRRRNLGCYMVNPDFIFKGTHLNRMNILIRYSKEESAKKEDKPITAPTVADYENQIKTIISAKSKEIDLQDLSRYLAELIQKQSA